jgi:hypothetical protein
MIKQVNRSEPYCNKWKKNARQAQRFRDGKQLSEEDERALEDQARPHNAFNAAQKFVAYISGVQRDSPTSLVWNAISMESDQVQLYSDMMGKYYDWAIAKARGSSERARVFEDFLVTGMGWANIYIDRTLDPRGLVGYDRIPPTEMLWSENSKINLGQSYQGCTRFRAWERLFENEEAKALFGSNYAHFLIDQGDVDGAVPLSWPQVDKVTYKIPYIETYPMDTQGGSRGKKKDQSRIMEFQWWDNQVGFVFIDPLDQTEQWMTQDEFTEYRDQLDSHFGATIDDFDRQYGRKWQRAFLLNRRHLLEEPGDMAGPRFSFNPMCYHYDEWDKEFYGFFRVLIDPQKYGNKFFNQLIEITGKQAKAGAYFEDGAFDDNAAEEQFLEEYSITGSVHRLAAGGLAKVRDKPVPDMPAATMAIMQFCVKAMETVTGISEDSLGLGSSTQAGVMLKRRQRAGMVLLAAEFDTEQEFRREEGYIVADHLKLLAAAGGDNRLIRVVQFPGQQQGEVVPLSSEPFSLLYDIMLDEQERDPNMRQFLTEWIMGPGGQMMLRAGMFAEEWLDLLPFPRAWVLHMKQTMKQKQAQAIKLQAQGFATPGQRGKTRPVAELQALIKNKDADTELKRARAQELGAKGKAALASIGHDKLALLLQSMDQQNQTAIDQNQAAMAQQKGQLDQHLGMASGAIDLAQKLGFGRPPNTGNGNAAQE